MLVRGTTYSAVDESSTLSFLGAFAKFQKATVGFIMSFFLSGVSHSVLYEFQELLLTEQVWNFQLYKHHYFGSVIPLFMQKIFIVYIFLE